VQRQDSCAILTGPSFRGSLASGRLPLRGGSAAAERLGDPFSQLSSCTANPALGWRLQEQTRNQVVGGSTGFSEAASSWIGTEAPEPKALHFGDDHCRQGG